MTLISNFHLCENYEAKVKNMPLKLARFLLTAIALEHKNVKLCFFFDASSKKIFLN